MQTEIETSLPRVDEILSAFKDVVGRDFHAYRNHVYRVVNLCYASGEFCPEAQEKIQIAGCFHDLGIWTGKTLDYLPPAIAAAEEYLRAQGRDARVPEISEMIAMHHCTRSCADAAFPLVEVFRRADIADFSLGLVRMGYPKSRVAALKAAFPNRGFHLRLLQLGTVWFMRHPLNPLPMFRR